jgi:thymidylate synthase
MKIYPTFSRAVETAQQQLIDIGKWVAGDQWQSVDVSKKPEMIMREVLNFSFQVGIRDPSLPGLRVDIRPNLPWADNHFEDRVGGIPLNPGIQWRHWPWALSADKFRDKDGQFSHTYMERIWPKKANLDKSIIHPHKGIRFNYGDLNNVVSHLYNHPLTRQAYLPIWFPEDTGVIHGERVPCTIGYHFIVRDGYMHTTYYIRSCDVVRHFRDDVYLAVRLTLWILDRLRERDRVWKDVQPGFFVMHIVSLHTLKNDYTKHVKDGKWHEKI